MTNDALVSTLLSRTPILHLLSFRCDLCEDPDMYRNMMWNIIHLNDTHKWSREKIADWVEEVESEYETCFQIMDYKGKFFEKGGECPSCTKDLKVWELISHMKKVHPETYSTESTNKILVDIWNEYIQRRI